MKNMKLKKLVVACQAAAMTALTCSSVSTQASDTELYKAPQTSETTLMFMLDLSGSMSRYFRGTNNSDKGYGCDLPRGVTESSRNYSETVSPIAGVVPYRRQWCVGNDGKIYDDRITRLKDGMLKLLKGDVDTTALEDKLAVGLSEFSGTTGRIKLEARPLSDNVNVGTGQLYRKVETVTWSESEVVTRTQTRNTNQTKTQSGTRTQTCRTTDGTSTGGNRWCHVSTVTNWSDSKDWSPTVERPTGTGGSSTSSGWSKGMETVTTVNQKCEEWDSANSCSSWVVTTEGAPAGSSVNNPVIGNTDYSPAVSGSESISYSQNDPAGTANTGSCTSNSSACTRTWSRTVTVTATGVARNSRDGSYIRTTAYTGDVYKLHRLRMIEAVTALSPTGNTPTAFAYAEVAAYMMGQTTKGLTGSGFSSSSNQSAIQDGSKYISPSRVTSSKQCNTQGIYFLTDGVPNYDNDNYSSFMKSSLGSTKGAAFSCSANLLETTGNSWGCIGNYANTLFKSSLNPAEVSIKTAVVGFGNDFSDNVSNPGADVKNAKKWGIVGQGGWYSGNSPADVVSSVTQFIRKMQKYIPPVTTGSVTVPVDNLDTQNIQPWGYFPQFDPAPDSKVTTWVGNLKKYQVVDHALKDKDNKDIMDKTTGVSVDDPYDFWADPSITKNIIKMVKENGVDTEKEYTVKVGGTLSRQILGSTGASPVIERNIYTDRKLTLAKDNTTYVVDPVTSGSLVKVASADLKANNDKNNLNMDTHRGYLAALFGYDITASMAKNLTAANNTEFNNFLTQENATLRQMGAVMHSKPILLTQKGTTTYDEAKDVITYEDRDDLIVFGTTQGLLHVVRAGKNKDDADAGKEVFVFAPDEMIKKQPTAFLGQTNQDPALRYGIDGQWTAYTEYVTKKSSSVNAPVVTVDGGKQWLYGGLRMGGRSYYSLDLSGVTSTNGDAPKIKFHINPQDHSCSSTDGVGCMGQSWSKPTVTWVNWQGKRKLVMLVGGGYDEAKYELDNNVDVNPSGKDQGAGVYMFDANDGSLLWWASAHAETNDAEAAGRYYDASLNRSVVSSIKTVDRNGDGIADHFYFGDLGGQLWRVDVDETAKAGVSGKAGANFAKRVVRILDATGTDAPRFYTTPTFTIHNSVNGMFAALSIGSGNFSYPMSAKTNPNDAVYVVYDKDVTRRNLSVLKTSELYTVDVKTSGASGRNLVKNTDGNTAVLLTNGGWYYPVGAKKRILNDHVAIDNDLYVSIFDSSVDIDDVSCYGGVRGESKAAQFCLPYGQCVEAGDPTKKKDRNKDVELGKGNIGISFGGKDKVRGLVLNFPTEETLKTYTGKTKFISQRWYER
jgi:type IV pilus assembly protein PilY1